MVEASGIAGDSGSGVRGGVAGSDSGVGEAGVGEVGSGVVGVLGSGGKVLAVEGSGAEEGGGVGVTPDEGVEVFSGVGAGGEEGVGWAWGKVGELLFD